MARIGLTEDLLVVLPTGLGKTIIAALLAAEALRRSDEKVLVLAPTRPLVQQHADSFARWLTPLRFARFTGTVKRPVREGAWETADVVFATPEIVVNDLAADRYGLSEVSLVVFDEAHHAVGKYAYVPLAARYRTDRPQGGRVLGLTASPGGKDERIEEVVANLGVGRIEARSREDDWSGSSSSPSRSRTRGSTSRPRPSGSARSSRPRPMPRRGSSRRWDTCERSRLVRSR